MRTKIDDNPVWLAAYRDAMAKDAAFQAAVVAQFGRKNAGTMRYASGSHNEATKLAAAAHWQASNRLAELNAEYR